MRIAPVIIALLFGLAAAAPSFAEKPSGTGQGKGQGQGQGASKSADKGNKGKSDQGGAGKGQGQGQGGQGQGAGKGDGNAHDHGPAPARYTIVERDHRAIYDYYGREFAGGHCPPGLAKKNNGCLPPGQAKKLWAVGQPLPRSVIYYPLPQPLVLQLTPAPVGYRYVRVADDVLLMQTANRLIIDAVINLNRF